MKTNAPKSVTWLIGTIAGVLGILGQLGHISAMSGYSSWLLIGGFALLSLGSILKDL